MAWRKISLEMRQLSNREGREVGYLIPRMLKSPKMMARVVEERETVSQIEKSLRTDIQRRVSKRLVYNCNKQGERMYNPMISKSNRMEACLGRRKK